MFPARYVGDALSLLTKLLQALLLRNLKYFLHFKLSGTFKQMTVLVNMSTLYLSIQGLTKVIQINLGEEGEANLRNERHFYWTGRQTVKSHLRSRKDTAFLPFPFKFCKNKSAVLKVTLSKRECGTLRWKNYSSREFFLTLCRVEGFCVFFFSVFSLNSWRNLF